MEINFFDDSANRPRVREEVRIEQLGLYLYEDRKRVACGFALTPFIERPSLETTIWNQSGDQVGSLVVITAMEGNFTLTMHLRELEPAVNYRVQVEIYYNDPETNERMVVDRQLCDACLDQPKKPVVFKF